MTSARSRFRHRGSAVALTIAAVLAFGTLFAAPASANSAESGPVTIAGDAIIGQTVTVDEGDWAEGTTFTYQWRTDFFGENIAGATSNSFTLTEAQRYRSILVLVTGTLDGASQTIVSPKISNIRRPQLAAGTVSISGSAVVGSLLTATAGNDWPEGASLAFAWSWGTDNGVNWSDTIDGATGTTFTVPADHVGHEIYIIVEASLDGYEPSLADAYTATVTAATTPGATLPTAQAPAATAPVATSAELAAFLITQDATVGTATSAGLPADGLDATKPYTATVDWAAADGFVDVYAYSTPTLVGTFPVVNGQVQIVLSSAMLSALAAGSHTLVITGQSSGSVQAVAFSITKTLAATGVETIVPLGSAALLLLLGAALVIVRRRRTLV